MVKTILNFGIFWRTLFGGIRHGSGNIAERVVGLDSWPLFIDGNSVWMSQTVLDDVGISHWGLGYHAGRAFFRVPKEHAYTAEKTLLDNGIAVFGHRLVGDA